MAVRETAGEFLITPRETLTRYAHEAHSDFRSQLYVRAVEDVRGGYYKVADVEARDQALGEDLRAIGVVWHDDGVVPGFRNDRAEIAEREYHAAINEPSYAGTREDWRHRAIMAEFREQARAEGIREKLDEALGTVTQDDCFLRIQEAIALLDLPPQERTER